MVVKKQERSQCNIAVSQCPCAFYTYYNIIQGSRSAWLEVAFPMQNSLFFHNYSSIFPNYVTPENQEKDVKLTRLNILHLINEYLTKYIDTGRSKDICFHYSFHHMKRKKLNIQYVIFWRQFFYASGSNDRGILFLVCLSVCLSVCLFVCLLSTLTFAITFEP